jgi:hypothetical protein
MDQYTDLLLGVENPKLYNGLICVLDQYDYFIKIRPRKNNIDRIFHEICEDLTAIIKKKLCKKLEELPSSNYDDYDYKIFMSDKEWDEIQLILPKYNSEWDEISHLIKLEIAQEAEKLTSDTDKYILSMMEMLTEI